MSTWQPIASAPKDGTWVLVFFPNVGDFPFPGIRRGYLGSSGWRGETWQLTGTPSHWMPLPAPPED